MASVFLVFGFTFIAGMVVLVLVQPEFRSDLISLFYVVLGTAIANAVVAKLIDLTFVPGGANPQFAALPILLFLLDGWILARYAYLSTRKAFLASALLAVFPFLSYAAYIAAVMSQGGPSVN